MLILNLLLVILLLDDMEDLMKSYCCNLNYIELWIRDSLFESLSDGKRDMAIDDGGFFTKHDMYVQIETEKAREDGEIKRYFDLKDQDFCDGETAIITGGGKGSKYTLLALEGAAEWKKEMVFSGREMKVVACKTVL